MGTILIEYSGDNSDVFVEVTPADVNSSSLELVADEGEKRRIAKAETTLRQQFMSLKEFTDTLYEPYEKSAKTPDELVIEFGIRIGIESGIVVAKGSAEASIMVKATWKRRA